MAHALPAIVRVRRLARQCTELTCNTQAISSLEAGDIHAAKARLKLVQVGPIIVFRVSSPSAHGRRWLSTGLATSPQLHRSDAGFEVGCVRCVSSLVTDGRGDEGCHAKQRAVPGDDQRRRIARGRDAYS
jgi:hypothetical protein